MTQAISTREGWSAFVSETLDKPVPITRSELDALSPADRAMNREARKQFMIRGPVVNTAQFAVIETEIRRRLMLNQYKSHGKLGVIVSGEPNIGKTTTVAHIARRFERRRRDVGRAGGANSIPVIYVCVPPSCTPKLMLGEFAHFLGLPIRTHYNTGELMNTVASVVAACGTELIIVDEIHNLNQKYKQMREASDTLKQLSEKCPGTFVYAGVEVEASGLVDGSRGRQVTSRFQIMHLHKFENAGKARASWADLLVAIEGSLGLIDQEPGAILRHATELHHATGGVIGDLTGMLHMLAMDAIDDGTERLDLDGVFGTVTASIARASR
ncbi:TniB family NTP-binding protein [Microbacterium flavum]|uniref:TniB family NTP-binding protein n=1 Tax=Microbacterium flavum TaxID=415216 RepID=UPI0024AE63A0|nr:TniB family NTP-binding protein [Microbacterium flavum]